MIVLNTPALVKASRKNAALRKALTQWLEIAEAADWTCLQDIRDVLPSTDGVAVKVQGVGIVVVTVFNIKGNEYRLISTVNYSAATVLVREVLTHAEYSKDAWKERL